MKLRLPKAKHAYEILLILIFILLAIHAHAEDTSPPQNSTYSESNISTSTGTTTVSEEPSQQSERVTPPTEHRAQLDLRLQDRITNLARNVEDRLNAGINRMSNIAGRIETRIAKLNTQGYPTEKAEAKLVEGKQALADAQSTLRNLGSVQQALASDSPRASMKHVRTTFQETREHLKRTHALLSESVTLLKEAIATGVVNPSEAVEANEATSTVSE